MTEPDSTYRAPYVLISPTTWLMLCKSANERELRELERLRDTGEIIVNNGLGNGER